MWYNKYVGIPYKANGRTLDGLDCWGLARHIYKEEYSIELPSFDTDYIENDIDRIQELLTQYREGWEVLDSPEEGCIVGFRLFGTLSHVGVMINSTQFIHNNSKVDTCIDTINNPKWKHRVVGYYKYSENAKDQFNNIPSILKTADITASVKPGMNIGEILHVVTTEAGLGDISDSNVIIFIDGNIVTKIDKDNYIIKEGQRVEFRLVPKGDNILRTVLTIAILAAAAWVATTYAPALAGVGAEASTVAAYRFGTQAVLTLVGVALVNAIVPIRPPDLANGPNPGSSNPQLLLNGARNTATPYQSIPVVLGRYRYVAPLGAINYLRVNTDTAYLRMLLVWGYGPLQVEDVRVGSNPLENYNDVVSSSSPILYDIVWTGTQYVAVGSPGIIYTSTDAITWTPQNTGTVAALKAINYTSGQYIVVGSGGTILTSTDAITWTPQTSGITKDINSIAYSGSLYVAVGDTGNVLTSTDRVTWTSRYNLATTTANRLNKVIWAGGRFIAVGNAGTIISSTNGISWVIAGTTSTDTLKGIAFNGTTYLIVGKSSDPSLDIQGIFLYSSNGISWTLNPNTTVAVSNGLISAYATTSKFVVVGDEGSIYTTTNLITWNISNGTNASPTVHVDPLIDVSRAALNAVVTNGTTHVIVGANGTVITSTTALSTTPTWVARSNKVILGLPGQNLDPIYSIYGEDTFQLTVNQKLTYSNSIADWITRDTGISKVNNVSVSIHFPEGLRGIYREGDNAGKTLQALFTGELQIRKFNPTTGLGVGSWVPYKESLAYGSRGAVTVTDTDNDGNSVTYTKYNPTEFYGRKDAFTVTLTFANLDLDYYQVRLRRTNSTVSDLDTLAGKPFLYHSALFYLLTGTNPTAKAVVPPNNTNLAMTAMEIRATDQLNGAIDGISALVTSICLDYTGTTWVSRATRNPASLFRHILQHPGNPQRVLDTDVSSMIDLPALEAWHVYCTANGFTYDAVVSQQRSLLEVLKDICAAGRASPLLTGGKWTVVIDKPRTTTIQHFTPHNSWGFSGTKLFKTMPHGIRINFVNEANEYQNDEVIFYSDGYSASNATLFESIQLPGITSYTNAYKHGRFHLAQARLRPELYTLNTDMEYLACNRGDLVKVSHDIPLWGSGTGRIKTFLSTTSLELSEEVLMQSGTSYIVRIRTQTGDSITRYITPVTTTGYYTTINLTATITSTEGAIDNLYMLGLPNYESVDLIVLSIEPSTNLTAKLTLVDYSPAIFDQDALTIPAFDTKITLPSIFTRNFINSVPIVDSTTIRSDESVMSLSGSSYVYKISIPFSNPPNLESSINSIEARLSISQDNSISWSDSLTASVTAGSVVFSGVIEGETYSVQLRYTDGSGFVGPWTTEIKHTIVGKTNPPAKVGSAITIIPEGDKLRITWPKNTEIDLAGYEVRDSDMSWGVGDPIFIGSANTCLVQPGPAGSAKTWYIRAFDGTNLYSTTSNFASYTVAAPSAPTGITASILDSTVLFKWSSATAGAFPVRNYLLSLAAPGAPTLTATRDTTDWEVPVNWVGTATLSITPIDSVGNSYSGSSNTVSVTIAIPDQPSAPTYLVDGTDLVVDWADNNKSVNQLAISSYEIKKADGTLIWKGTASLGRVSLIGLTGTLTYSLYAYDTYGNISPVRSFSYTIVASPNVVNDSTLTYTFGTSLSDSTLTLNWANVVSPYGSSGYEITYDSKTITTISNTVTISPLPTAWLGGKTFTIKSIDNLGNKSSGTSFTITKLAPSAVTGVRADVIDNTVMLYWTLPTRTTLPISHVLVKKGSSWSGGVSIGEKSGTFTTIFETQSGTYQYWITAIDTDNQEGTPYSITLTVSQPPNFIFNGNYTSTFTGTLNNAILDTDNTVVLPANNTINYQDHFINNSWSTPQQQIDATYPIYVQPTVASGYYEEVIDFGTVFNSSQLTLTTNGTIIAGAPIITSIISYSLDNITYNGPYSGTLLFINNFRYVKVRISVAQTSSDKAVYALNYLNVRLDAKISDTSGTTSCVSTDTNGTTALFGKQFVDVTSINVTPQGTTPLIPVYNFQDSIISGTYSITSNICTVTTSSAHGFTDAGEAVRLSFSTGSAPNGIYTISSVISTTQYTVSITTANTSGNVSTYPQSMKIYLFTTTGARASGTVSWAIKGY